MSADLLSRVKALRADIATADPALYNGTDAMTMAEAMAATEKACGAARTRFAARAAETSAPRGKGFADSAEWLARIAGKTTGQAKTELEVAEALEKMPETREAFGAGELSVEQAGVIVATENSQPGSEHQMLDLARRTGLKPLRDEGRKRQLAGVDPEVLRVRQWAKRSVSHWTEPDGMIGLKALLPPEVGVPLVNRLTAATDARNRAARRAGDRATPWTAHAADALVAMTETPTVAEAGAGAGDEAEPSNRAKRRAKGRHGQAELVVVVDLNALRRGHAEEGEPCHIIGGGPVPVSLPKEMIEGDAFLKAVLHDGVEVQTVKHFGRKNLKAEVLTALLLGPAPRFEGIECCEPGCGRKHHLEIEHEEAVTNGGWTALENLRFMCWPHHVQKTERDLAEGRDPP